MRPRQHAFSPSLREALLAHMVDVGELIRRGEDFYEDMGGHVSHESNLDGHIESYLNGLSALELAELRDELGLTDRTRADFESDMRAERDAEVRSLNRKD